MTTRYEQELVYRGEEIEKRAMGMIKIPVMIFSTECFECGLECTVKVEKSNNIAVTPYNGSSRTYLTVKHFCSMRCKKTFEKKSHEPVKGLSRVAFKECTNCGETYSVGGDSERGPKTMLCAKCAKKSSYCDGYERVLKEAQKATDQLDSDRLESKRLEKKKKIQGGSPGLKSQKNLKNYNK